MVGVLWGLWGMFIFVVVFNQLKYGQIKKRESKYVKIDIVNKIIYRYNDAVYANGLDIVLEDPLIV